MFTNYQDDPGNYADKAYYAAKSKFARAVNPTQPTAALQPDLVMQPAPTYEVRKPKRGSFVVLLLVVCLCASSAFGFLGGYLSNRMNSDDLLWGQNGVEVMYQTVVRNVAAGDPSASQPLSMSDVAAVVKQTVVEITTEGAVSGGRLGQLITTGAGSGVIVTGDGYIVTNYHVVSGARNITVRLSDGQKYNAALVGIDTQTDLAVLKINITGLTPVVLGDSARLLVGEPTVAVGNPLGELGGTVTGGIISALDREIIIDGETMSLLQTDAAINPGNSGGGLFNLYGELIGIINAKSSGTDIEGLGFAIPVNTAKEVIEDIITHGYVLGRIDTGLTLVDISSVQMAMMYRVNQIGLYISKSVDSNFQSGDRIVGVNGSAISNLASFKAALSSYSVGDQIELTVVRGNRQINLPLILTELKA